MDGNLLREILRHRFAIGLVALVGFVDVALRFAVKLADAANGRGPAYREKLARQHRRQRPDTAAQSQIGACATC